MKTLEEGGVYIISRALVVSAPPMFRSVDRDVSLNFYHKTTSKKTLDNGIIPKYKFELQNFEDMDNLIENNKSFIG